VLSSWINALPEGYQRHTNNGRRQASKTHLKNSVTEWGMDKWWLSWWNPKLASENINCFLTGLWKLSDGCFARWKIWMKTKYLLKGMRWLFINCWNRINRCLLNLTIYISSCVIYLSLQHTKFHIRSFWQ
jgi:hypothetical protein